MINKLTQDNISDVIEFLKKYNFRGDVYITKGNQRIFLEKDIESLKSIIKNQECYGQYDKELLGLYIILKEKGYRTYLKIIANNEKTAIELVRYFNWNYEDEIYVKIKKNNPFVNILIGDGFKFLKPRPGQELLLFKIKLRSKNDINYN
jgi:Zn-finger domain-containing protein